MADEQLSLGLDVIVDCVNPLALTRDSWVSTAQGARAAIVEVEVVCSDPVEHRRRVETRVSDVEGGAGQADLGGGRSARVRPLEPGAPDR